MKKGFQKKAIAVALGQIVQAMAAFLGATYAGCFYTSLDTDMSESRIRKILETLEPDAVITSAAYREKMATAFQSKNKYGCMTNYCKTRRMTKP